MAAHGLTIMRQVAEMIRKGFFADQIVDYTSGALLAPGTCCTNGFAFATYQAIARVVDRMKRGEAALTDLQRVVDQAIQTHMWMDAYPSMEAVQAAYRAYVQIGLPNFRQRLAKFEAGDAGAHAVARQNIADRFPLERRAPTFG